MQSCAFSTSGRPFTCSTRPCRPAVARRAVVVPLALKPTKAADFRSLPDSDIEAKLFELRKQLSSVRALQRAGIAELKQGEKPDKEKIPKTHLNKHIRLQIAQLETVKRERSLQAGVTKREARRAEKRKMLVEQMLEL